ncbi:NAD(P)H-dependent oxidoreductase [Desulfonatronum lacustre]|uniref:flavodoxin family protein n=1 Tax=Desulfonatronum lacustre TaxID=66849 RepID=UPI0004B94DE4
MYAIAVNGSPRKGGNTEFLLNRVLEPLAKAGWETELVQVDGQNIPGSVYRNMGSGRDKGEVEKDAEGLGNMKNLGQVIAWLGQAIQPHVGSFPALAVCPEIRATLRIPDDHAIGYALLFGRPAVQYHRPVKRRPARVNMLGLGDPSKSF